MDITLHNIKVRDLVEGYEDKEEEGVLAYADRLVVRPPYQREFIYNETQQMAVIDTILKGYPLNVMYWAKREDGTFEIIDGQQRTLSICKFYANCFNIKINGSERYFSNLEGCREHDLFMNYELTVYICEGDRDEKLEWFKTINIAGEKLTNQELRNAAYAGTFVTDAKRYFSKTACTAYKIGSDYLTGTPIRQDYLETAIRWHTRSLGEGSIENYMAKHANDVNANLLKQYYAAVIEWAKCNFDVKKFKKIVKGVDWGLLYDNYHGKTLDVDALAAEISKLIMDSEVQKKLGIIPYVLTRDERTLGLRTFPDDMKLEAYEAQGHKCKCCGKEFDFSDMDGDHILPWSKGGKTIRENLQMLCRKCNQEKGGK